MSFDKDPIVQTTHGQVRGKKRLAIYGDKYYCFDGIPYAKPPLGQLRFKAPQTAPTWQGILDCTEVKPKSLQVNPVTKEIEGSEDCLYLNVYAKKLRSAKRMPVIVFIHGGIFNRGESSRNSWGPDYFMMKEVLLISIGYRLGALGFLSLHDTNLNVPGNAGLKDIILALRWIKENCQNFNGDMHNITLLGHSAGADAVVYLMLCNQAKGLFHKAIPMSSSTFITENIPKLAQRLAEHIGYNGESNDEEQILKYLSEISAEQLLDNSFWTPLDSFVKATYPMFPFYPTVEPYFTTESVITAAPLHLLQNSWGNSMPIMLGISSFEALLFFSTFASNSMFYQVFKKCPEYMLPLELQLKCDNADLKRKLAERLLNAHFKGKELCEENVLCLLDLMSCRIFTHSQRRKLLARLAYSKAPTYLYYFHYESQTFSKNRQKRTGKIIKGVSHGEELSYLFFTPQIAQWDRDSTEFKIVERMVDIFVAFAESSDPNKANLDSIVWKPLESNDAGFDCLKISEEINFCTQPDQEKLTIWDSLFNDLNVKMY